MTQILGEGEIYLNTTTNTFHSYQDGKWRDTEVTPEEYYGLEEVLNGKVETR